MDKNLQYPVILLQMRDNEKKSCPFVTAEGCSVYPDRPWACRMYPLGLASPNSTAAKAFPPSWPGYQASTIAAAASIHSLTETTEPLIEHYTAQGVLKTVPGADSTPDAVFGKVEAILAGVILTYSLAQYTMTRQFRDLVILLMAVNMILDAFLYLFVSLSHFRNKNIPIVYN